MKTEAEKEEEEVGQYSWWEAGEGRGRGSIEEESKPSVAEKRYEEKREQLDSESSPCQKPWRKSDVLGSSYKVDIVSHYQWKLCYS